MTTPLILISGYLGSGKTTLLEHLLNTTDKKIAILMNEFGDIGIDTQTLQGENIAIKELLEGCVCCSLQGEFEAGVAEIIEKYSPDLILVETTGIAEADNLVLDIEEEMVNVTLQCVVTVVDADLMVRFPQMTGSTKIQIETADLLVLNKIDLVTNTSKLITTLTSLNPTAAIIETTYSNIDLDQLLRVKHLPKDITVTTKEHGMESFSIEVAKSLDKGKFEQFLENLPDEFVRVKGYCTVDTEPVLLNYVNGNYSFSAGYGKQQLVFIGQDVKAKKPLIQNLLLQCY